MSISKGTNGHKRRATHRRPPAHEHLSAMLVASARRHEQAYLASAQQAHTAQVRAMNALLTVEGLADLAALRERLAQEEEGKAGRRVVTLEGSDPDDNVEVEVDDGDEEEPAECYFCGSDDTYRFITFEARLDGEDGEVDALAPWLEGLPVCDECIYQRSTPELMRVAASLAIAPTMQLDEMVTKTLEASDACDALDACSHASFVEVSMVEHPNAAVCLDCGARRIGVQWKAPRLVALACDSARSLRKTT